MTSDFAEIIQTIGSDIVYVTIGFKMGGVVGAGREFTSVQKAEDWCKKYYPNHSISYFWDGV